MKPFEFDAKIDRLLCSVVLLSQLLPKAYLHIPNVQYSSSGTKFHGKKVKSMIVLRQLYKNPGIKAFKCNTKMNFNVTTLLLIQHV